MKFTSRSANPVLDNRLCNNFDEGGGVCISRIRPVMGINPFCHERFIRANLWVERKVMRDPTRNLEVEVFDVQRVLLDELTARLNDITH